MAFLPCVKDTVTVTWDFDAGVLEANIVVSGDANNAIQQTDAGLLVDSRSRDYGRLFGTQISIPTGGQQQAWNVSAGRFSENAPAVNVAGLYHVTASLAWAASAAGTFRALFLIPTTSGTQYPAVNWHNASASTFNQNQHVVLFDGIIPLTVGNFGILPPVVAQQDTGGALLTEADAQNAFAYGAEFMLNLLMEM